MLARLLWCDQTYESKFVYELRHDSFLTDVIVNDANGRALYAQKLYRSFRYNTTPYQYDFSRMRSLLDNGILGEYKGIMFVYLYGFIETLCSNLVDWRKEGF
jgi:hypothetical protein